MRPRGCTRDPSRSFRMTIHQDFFANQFCSTIDKEIEDAQMEVDIVYPFVGGARIDHIIAAQEKAKQKAHLDQLLAKRREIEVNLSLIQDYVKKATR